jgi:FixJ family two-component response regulator
VPVRQPIIAIVDDDPALLAALTRLLMAHGYGVETYESAEDYLNVMGASRAACLIVDVQLGGLSGLDLIRQLRQRLTKLPIICMSGSRNSASRDEAADLGCVAYLHKPFPPGQLADVIRENIGPSRDEACRGPIF